MESVFYGFNDNFIVKKYYSLFFFLVINAFFIQSLHAAIADETSATEDPPPTLETLLVELTSVSLSRAAPVIDQLEAVGGRDLLPLFQTMLEGDLYYDENTLQVIALSENSEGEDVGVDILSGENLGVVEDWDIKKIRVNNRLRTLLRKAIARINLLQGTDSERESSALAMLGDINADNKALLDQALPVEKNSNVLELIQVGIAMYTMSNADEQELRFEALDILKGRLESPVRNLLASFLDEDNSLYEEDPLIREAIVSAQKKMQQTVAFYGFIEKLFFGLSLGSVLLLAAIGLAVTFGVMGVINLAHGEMLMLGAYTTYVIQQLLPNHINYSIWLAIPAAFMVSATVGILIQRFVIRYLNGRPLETLLATFGISLILQQTVRTIFSPLNRRVISPDWMSGSWEINPVLAFTYNRLYILLFALIVFFILLLVMKKTSLGLYVRAVSQNRDMAKAMGIKTDRVDALTFGLGSGIAGMAGVALSQLTNVGPNLGQAYIIDSFMVVVFGGVGNLFGTLVGAFSLGMFNKFLEPVTGAVLANIMVLVFIILFIQKRPKGLFPQKGRAAE
jgi:urea transport system permease protein